MTKRQKPPKGLRLSPGERAIVFKDGIFWEGRICTEEYHPCHFWDMGTLWVFIYKEGEPSYTGSMHRSKNLCAWSEGLWTACQEWQKRKEQLDKEYELLSNGKIPENQKTSL